MIKLIHIITGLSTGGAEMSLYRLLAGTDLTIFAPTVISLMNAGTLGHKIKALGVPVHELNMSAGRPSLSALWSIWARIQKENPDIIQGWMYHGNLASSLGRLARIKPIPVLWNIRHCLYNMDYEKKGTATVIRVGSMWSKSAETIIYNSRTSAIQHEHLGYAQDRSRIIPNGFDCARFKPSQSARHALCNELKVNTEDILIGLVGRFHPMKDHLNFFKAAGILISKYKNVQFVLAGTDIEQENAELAKMISENLSNRNVHLLGERNDIPELSAGLDIATSSSLSEAFPNVVAEAMASGVPCVVTDVGDSAWIVGDTGRVVPAQNADALAKAWAELIEVGQEERIKFGKAARQRISTYFSIQSMLDQYQVLYEGTVRSCQ